MDSFASKLQELSFNNKVVGPKGAIKYGDTGKQALNFNISINQSSPVEDIVRFLESVLMTKDPQEISDLFITVINKRHPRNGEGCKATGLECLLQLYEQGYQNLIIQILEFVPEFGCIKDYWKLIGLVNKRLVDSLDSKYYEFYNPLVNSIINYFWMYIDKDIAHYEEWKVKYADLDENEREEKLPDLRFKLSNAGKWAPREKGADDLNTHWYVPVYYSLGNAEDQAKLNELLAKGELTQEEQELKGNLESNLIVKTYQKQQLRKMLIRHKYFSNAIVFNILPKIKPDLQKATRKTFSLLNKLSGVCEVKTCSGRWSEIDPATAPSGFTMKQRKAWLNEKGKQKLMPHEASTGNRYPDDQDRVDARNILLGGLSKVKGGILAPYQIIQKIKHSGLTEADAEMMVLQAQWDSLVESTLQGIYEFIKELRIKKVAELEASGITSGEEYDKAVELAEAEVTEKDLVNILAMIDVSPSMTASAGHNITCMDLSISLGILASQLNRGPFKNMALSFSSEPIMFHFVDPSGKEYSLLRKYTTITRSMGYTTDIMKAMWLIVKEASNSHVPETELPGLLILSDEGFDRQIIQVNATYGCSMDLGPSVDYGYDKQWSTTHDNICRLFRQYGYSNPPQINYWNLNAAYVGGNYGYQEQADRVGVSMLTGWNTSSFKMVMAGQEVVSAKAKKEREGDDKEKKSAWDDFRSMIDQDCYVWVKQLMNECDEGALNEYTYTYTYNEEEDESRNMITLDSLRGVETDNTDGFDIVDECEIQNK